MPGLHEIRLTAREHEVLTLVACGMSAKEVSIRLCIAPCTVERHVENVRLKTRTRNRAHMVAHAIRSELITPFGPSLDAPAVLPVLPILPVLAFRR